jgi:hypothetical protein
MALEAGDVRADNAPPGLDAAPQGSPIPAETRGVPPPSFTATGEPDLSEEGLAKAARKAKTAKPATGAPAKGDPPDPRAPADEPASEQREEPAGEAPEAEEPNAEPKPKEEEPPADRITAQLRAREKAFVGKQTAFARERAEFDQYKQSTEAQIAQHRTQVAQSQQVLELVRQDPLQLLRAVGWTPELIAERLSNGNKPSPQEIRAQARRELAEGRREIAAERQRLAQLAEEAEEEKELSQFVTGARSDQTRWPLSSRYSEAKLRSQGLAIVHHYAAQGIALSNEEVLDKLEDELTEIASLGKNGKTSNARAARPGRDRAAVAPTLTSEASGERSVDLDGVDMLELELKDPDAFAAMRRAEIDNETRRRSPK